MAVFLLDSSVLLDIITRDPVWYDWSFEQISHAHTQDEMRINPLIYAEIAGEFKDSPSLDQWLVPQFINKAALPYEAAFRASEAFLKYRKLGGSKTSPLPDFYIGAHAAVEGLTLITRDSARFKTYFPDLHLISPDSAA